MRHRQEETYIAVPGQCTWCCAETDDMERDNFSWSALNGERVPICEKCDRTRKVFTIIEPATREALERAALDGGWKELPDDWLEVAQAGAAPYHANLYEEHVQLPRESLMAVEVHLFTVICDEPMVVGPFRAFQTKTGILYTHFENFC